MSMPVKALRFDLLTAVPDKEAEITQSGHPVTKYSWTENGTLLTGCFKPVDPTYPPLLSRYSVAYSVWLRMIIGERAAEERLVYDSRGAIVGSMSIKLPKYRPLLGGVAGRNNVLKPGSSEEDARVMLPDVKTLEEYNAAELLIADWLTQDEDRHDGNWSLDGTIDNDMRGYGITSLIKGIRWILRKLEAVIHKVMEMRREDLDNFPCIKGRTYWPANPLPGFTEAWKRYNLNPQAFRDLAQSPVFVQQMFTVMLRVLVVWQPNVLRARLTEYLGDEKLDYKALDTEEVPPGIFETLASPFMGSSTPKSRKLEEQYPKFFSPEANEKPFVDHILGVFTAMHNEFRDITVLYPGCEACEEDSANQRPKRIAKPAFHRFLLECPEAWQAAKNWVITQNSRISASERLLQNASSSVQDALGARASDTHFDMDLLERNYHEIWRDAFLPQLDENLSKFEQLALRLRPPASPAATVSGDLAIPFVPRDHRAVGSSEAYSAALLIRPSPLGAGRTSLPGSYQSSTEDALAILTDVIDPETGAVVRPGLVSRLRTCITHYSQVPLGALTQEVSSAFGDELEDLKIALERNIRDKLGPDDNPIFSTALAELEALIPQVRFSRHVNRINGASFSLQSPLSSSSGTFFPFSPPPVSLTDDKVVVACVNALFVWADLVEPVYLNPLIVSVVDKDYEKATLFGTWSRHRGNSVREYLKASNESGAQRLGWVFAGGSREDGALNTALVERLYPLMLENVKEWMQQRALPDTLRKDYPCLQIAIEACKSHEGTVKRRFDEALPLYTQRTCEVARTDERFTHVHVADMDKRVNDRLYEWVSRQSPAVFSTLVNSAIATYEKGGWSWGLGSSRKRGPAARATLNRSELSNTQKLGLLLSAAESAHPDSSLNSYILTHLLDTMKLTDEVRTEPRYACVRAVDKAWWNAKLLPKIAELSKPYANGAGPAAASASTPSVPASSVPVGGSFSFAMPGGR